MEGAIEAIREMREPDEVRLVVNELTEISMTALREHYVTLVDATPLPQLCMKLVKEMAKVATEGISDTPGQIFLQPELFVPESI